MPITRRLQFPLPDELPQQLGFDVAAESPAEFLVEADRECRNVKIVLPMAEDLAVCLPAAVITGLTRDDPVEVPPSLDERSVGSPDVYDLLLSGIRRPVRHDLELGEQVYAREGDTAHRDALPPTVPPGEGNGWNLSALSSVRVAKSPRIDFPAWLRRKCLGDFLIVEKEAEARLGPHEAEVLTCIL